MVVAIIFIFSTIMKYDIDLTFFKNPQNIIASIICIMIYCGLVYFNSYIWKIFLEIFSCKRIPIGKITAVYTKSNLAKYIPGNFMHFAGRNLLGSELGVTQKQLAVSTFLEVFFLVGIGMILSIILGGTQFFDIMLYYILQLHVYLIGAIVIVFLSIACVFIVFVYNKRLVLLEYINMLWKELIICLPKLLILYTVSLLIPALVLVYLLNWDSSLTIYRLSLIIPAYIISWIVGFIIPGAPGGLGIRESILIVMLDQLYGGEKIVLAVILQRLISIFGDVFAFLISVIQNRSNYASGKENG